MSSATLSVNPFSLIVDPAAVRRSVDMSEQLKRLRLRRCHPLDRAVIRSPSAELAAYDAKIDRATVYLPPEPQAQPLVRTVRGWLY